MRVWDWPERLWQAVEDARRTPFEWGAHDCATWTFDTVALLTSGPSRADAWRGRYTNRIGAARVMLDNGWRSLSDMGDVLLQTRVSPLEARRGDVALVGDALGMVVGQSVAVLGEDDLHLAPIRQAQSAWRVD